MVDNLPPVHPRPLGVGALEEAIRQGLGRAVDGVPAMRPDPAGVAIERARGMRRRRTTGGAMALVVATLAASGVGVTLSHDPPRSRAADPVTPVPFPERPASVPVDVVMDGTLVSAAGDSIDLSGVGKVTAGYRTDGGWLVIAVDLAAGAGPRQSLWYASPTAAPKRLLERAADAVVVDPAGLRVAWRDATGLSTATVAQGALVASAHTTAPAETTPVGFAGDAVRLTHKEVVGQDLWHPGGSYGSRITTGAATVYGALPDGTLVGQAYPDNDGERCLALLAPSDLHVLQSACGLAITLSGQGWISPTGRWLLAEASLLGEARSALIDLTAVFGGEQKLVPVPGPPPAGGASWENRDTVVRATQGTLQRLRLDRLWLGHADGIEDLALAGLATADGLIVVTRVAL